MKKSYLVAAVVSLMLFSCGSAELEEENTQLKSKVAQLEKELKETQYNLEEQTKLAAFNKKEADTARSRAEELLKNCK